MISIACQLRVGARAGPRQRSGPGRNPRCSCSASPANCWRSSVISSTATSRSPRRSASPPWPARRSKNIILPLGISFFTFTQIAFLVDVTQGPARTRHLLDYALFVIFFPHLIAGPILHHREMMPQFADPRPAASAPRISRVGLTLFFIGLFKKVVLADRSP